ncbi:hypothetical protein BDY21DRAFT_342804 [Lineolata rhizophorae]|uniref:Uncharacterized protein n=1 Tax=Lineolata rhizophorae TaxID=578093 RepID=A0A6A6P1M9_9PEZI|nr:hypothetical protein BDY21DRAFT_342804 [Lineolata rhizophorae]
MSPFPLPPSSPLFELRWLPHGWAWFATDANVRRVLQRRKGRGGSARGSGPVAESGAPTPPYLCRWREMPTGFGGLWSVVGCPPLVVVCVDTRALGFLFVSFRLRPPTPPFRRLFVACPFLHLGGFFFFFFCPLFGEK